MPTAGRRPSIRWARERGVERIVILRPVIDNHFLSDLTTILNSLSKPGSLPLVLTSNHPSVFLAGADLVEIEKLNASTSVEYARRGRAVVRLIEMYPAPTVAAVHGSCSGGGVDLTLAFDAMICRQDAIFQHPGIRRGLVTGWSGTTVLPHALGPDNVRRMLLQGFPLDGQAMMETGLALATRENPEVEAIDAAISLGALEPERLRLWRALRKPGFIDRFRATVVHKV